ncbi:dihydrofolate reductase [Moraxella sp. ZY200743]|uniref:dihydrofolate reductase n=1 Tax=Moraxella sp. ZY200743 TaxID=2911970 RepID=UPI003D7C5F45
MNNLTTTKQLLKNKNLSLIQVVAFDQKQCIGKDNQLAWHIPEDLKHFKSLTTGGVVIMGRKTYESIGKPLPNRTNWVVTKDKAWTAQGVKVAHSLECALELASNDCQDGKLFIIGGGEIYRQSIDIADVLEITRVDLDIGGDAFYPAIPSGFELTHREHSTSSTDNTAFVFESYQRIARV